MNKRKIVENFVDYVSFKNNALDQSSDAATPIESGMEEPTKLDPSHEMGDSDEIYEPKEIEMEEPADKKEFASNYMFFYNTNAISRMIDEISKMGTEELDAVLEEHDWISDHISSAKESIEHVYGFLKDDPRSK